MCGRYDLQVPKRLIIEQFHLTLYDDPKETYYPNHNVCPTQTLPIVTNTEPERLNFARWGLVPFWAKDDKIGAKMINARAETLAEKPSFKNALTRRRCLVPAAAFYEWRKDPKGKTPLRFTHASGELLAFAGLWEVWKPPRTEEPLRTFTIITTTANDLLSEIHERMPVILAKEDRNRWLDGTTDVDGALSLLLPFSSNEMRCEEVASASLKISRS